MRFLQLILIILACSYIYFFIKKINFKNDFIKFESKKKYLLLGFISNFFDFLGVGSYAQQTAVLNKDNRYKEDVYLYAGTFSIGNFVPTVLEALITITVINVDMLTIIVLPVSAAIGAYIGAKFVGVRNNELIKKVLSIALLITGILLLLNAFNIPPFNNIETTLNGLSGKPVLLIVASISFFILGMLQSFGLGIYAPGFALLGLMGVSYIAIMPINMLSTVVLTTTNSIEFLGKDKHIKPVSMCFTIAGSIGVICAAIFAVMIDFTSIVIILQIIIAILVFYTAYKIIFNK